METYNYDDTTATPGFGPEGSVTPSVPDSGNANDAPATPGFGPSGPSTPSLPGNGSDVPATPGFGPNGPATPSLPGNGNDVTAAPGFGPLGPVTPTVPSFNNQGCLNCTGNVVWPNTPAGILWTWGTLSPFFSTTSDIAHVRFYNASAIREPLDIYLNGRLVVSNLDYMNYTRYLHIIPGVYRLTVFRRTNPGVPIIDTGVQFRGGNSYTLAILGTVNNFSVQIITA